MRWVVESTSFLDTFTDKKVPEGYALFNIVPITIGDEVEFVVTFAVQDAAKHDDVKGPGNGIVVAEHGVLKSPWGFALAPSNFGDLSGALLIGSDR